MGISDIAVETLVRWREHPGQMVRELWNITPDAWQDEAFEAFANPRHQRIAMKSAKGPGKTFVLAMCGINFLLTRPDAQGAACSISGDNLKDGLWAELSLWIGRSPLVARVLEWQATRIVNKSAPPGTSWLSARQWSKTADATRQKDTLAGLHADYILFLLDESGGIPQSVMATAEAVLAAGLEAKIVQAGNPTQLDGPLYRACVTDRAHWAVVEITGDPDDPKRAPRISIEWARQQIKTYGRENPWVLCNVLAKFPPASINSLLGPEEVREAMARHLRSDVYDESQKRIGVDVARFGDDRTCVWPRQGAANFKPETMRNLRTTEIAARVARAATAWGAEIILVDDTGHWGHGVIDNLLDAGYPAVPVYFSAPSSNPKRYNNRRTEMWMRMADAIKAGAALPPVVEATREWTEPTYTFINGVFVLESKKQVKERLGYSPDLADACALTYALPDAPRGAMALEHLLAQQARKKAADWDPYDTRDDA